MPRRTLLIVGRKSGKSPENRIPNTKRNVFEKEKKKPERDKKLPR